MEKFTRTIFLNEVVIQCRFALMSMSNLRAALRRGDTIWVFHSAHSFLIFVANVSKLFWPDRKTIYKQPDARTRGDELRRELEVTQKTPIKDRKFRNHFEHYDDRIQEWAASSVRRNYADMNIMPPGAISGIDINDFMRNLEPNTLTLTFHGESYNLLDAESEIKRIFSRACTIREKRSKNSPF